MVDTYKMYVPTNNITQNTGSYDKLL